jgi:hypothetical protein
MALAYEECASKSCCSFSTSAAHGADIWCGSLHQCHVDEWPRTTVLNPRSNLAAYTSSIAHKARILWRKMLMRKLRLIFAGAALCGGLTAEPRHPQCQSHQSRQTGRHKSSKCVRSAARIDVGGDRIITVVTMALMPTIRTTAIGVTVTGVATIIIGDVQRRSQYSASFLNR